MKKQYKITIMLRSGILDNAGKAVTKSLLGLGFSEVKDVKIGKNIYITTEDTIEDIIKHLYNEVMEDYEIECLDDVD